MKNRKYEVRIYYSSFCDYIIDAKDKLDAILKARNRNIGSGEIMTNLEAWHEADTIEEITKDYEKD